MILFEGKVNHKYEIYGVYVEEEITRRLEALGLNEGTEVVILTRKRNGALIISVRGTKLALGKHITSKIEIVEEKANE